MVGRLGHLLPKTSFKIRWNYQNFQYFWELRFRNKWKVAIIRFHLTHETNIRKIHGIGEESEEICCKLQTISEIFGTSWPANGLSVSSIRNSIKRKTVAFPSVHHSYISISTSQLHFHQYVTATFPSVHHSYISISTSQLHFADSMTQLNLILWTDVFMGCELEESSPHVMLNDVCLPRFLPPSTKVFVE